MEKHEMKTNRRVFMMQIVLGSSALAVASVGARAAVTKLDANDGYAKSMGFVKNAKDVDAKKWRKYKVGQQCTQCQLWDGKEKDAYAACSFFGDQHTPAAGWCKNFKANAAA